MTGIMAITLAITSFVVGVAYGAAVRGSSWRGLTKMQTEQKRRVNFVAPDPPAFEAPVTVETPTIQITDTSAAWAGIASPALDSVSALDRAQAFRHRMMPIYVTVVLVSLAVTLLYALVAITADVAAPLQLDKFLVFLFVLSAGLFVTHTRANKTDYDHTHAGTERLRLKTAAEIRRAELDAELRLRLAALETQVRLIESRHSGAKAPRGTIGVDYDRT